MDIGFLYNLECDEEKKSNKIVLYYKKEEFDTLAGLHCTRGMDEDEIDKRIKIAVDQSVQKLYEDIPNLPAENLESWLEFYENKETLPMTVGRRIRIV